MANEKKLTASPIADKDLAEVAGGGETIYVASKNKYYRYSPNYRNMYEKYLCPNCGRPVTPDFLCIKWSCKPCDSSWVFEFRLKPNIAAGGWRWVTKEEYDRCTDKSPLDR